MIRVYVTYPPIMTTVHPYIHLQTKANSKNINKLNSKETSISCNENILFISTNKLLKRGSLYEVIRNIQGEVEFIVLNLLNVIVIDIRAK